MYLKRLELQGFKSFSEKIKLDFNKGITAVVGPNGSGKSNISDAVRWVLGEQSARTLRGIKMEDIIFAGTENRKPLGFAEVSMIIDNSDRKLNIDYSEIKVTRKVYRSGDSEYQINGINCRLKDIHQMFMDTGIGREGYSIIGQGRIEEILSARSEDRRLLFEDAAGIVKFKNRKQEALNKLEKQGQNLVRISDIISELELQIGSLEEQSEKAKIYLDLKEKHKLLQVNLFLSMVENSEIDVSKAEENIANLKFQIQEEKNKLDDFTAEVTALKETTLQTEDNIKNKTEFVAELRSGLEQKDNDIKFTFEQINNIQNEIKRIESEIKKKEVIIKILEETINLERSRYNGLSMEISSKNTYLESKQKEFEILNTQLSESEEKIDRFNSEIIEKLKETTTAKENITKVQNSYEQLENRKEQLNEEKIYQNLQIKEKSVKLQATENLIDELDVKVGKTIKNQTFLEQEIKDVSSKIEDGKAHRVQINRNLEEASSRLQILNELEKSYEGYYGSVKSILLQKKEDPNEFSGIFGAVGELVETKANYETAIEIALGSSLQNIVTKDENSARAGIEYLKNKGKGRATFLPLTAIKLRDMSVEKEKILKEQGVLGIGKDLIKYDRQYENIFSNLLGKVVVVDNLENAIKIYKKYNYAYKTVTLSGELLNVGGAMTGGSVNNKSSHFFGRAREIKELKEKIEKLSREKEEISEKLEKFKEKHQLITSGIEDNRLALQEKAIERAKFGENISQTKTILENHMEKVKELDFEDIGIMEQIIDANREIKDFEEKYSDVEKEMKEIEQNLANFQNTLLSDRGTKDGYTQELTNLKVDINIIAQNLNEITNNLKRMENESQSASHEIKSFNSELDTKKELILNKQKNIEIFRVEAKKLNQEQNINNQLIKDLYDVKAKTSNKLEKLEVLGKESRELYASLNTELTRFDMKNDQLKEERRKMFDEMWDEYSLTYQSAKEYNRLEMPIDKMKAKERQIKMDIQNMGHINVGALEEFKLVKERYEIMSKQQKDILDAEIKLKQLIKELVVLMESQFKEQFAIISENFNSVFKEMFGGGKAHLCLADENNILESGIDIIAQPPGKTLQSMSLLSGGERALTATALLFGILRMKPSPFCILDEVEAALDDANVNRYANFIKNFSRDTQFILITHRKGTMEAADILYGVTMQEQGVSKLVSVNFTEDTVI